MYKYHCISCHYYTNHRPNFERHIRSKKHKKNVISVENSTQNSTIFNTDMTQPNVQVQNEPMMYFCKFCNASFTSNSSRYRHQSKYCKKNDVVDVNKLMQLLNEKNEEIESKDKKIEELMQKLECQVMTNNGTIVQGNQQNIANIQLLNYNKTDYDFLSDSDYIRCFMDNNHCVKKLIEKVHFNPNKPENMNVYISSMKGKYVMVYRDNVWQLKNRKQQIDDLYETNELVLEQWFDEYKEQYPDIIKSFTRYLKNKSNDHELIRSVKDEVMLMLYNKRYLISD